jgi:hypothetical protein
MMGKKQQTNYVLLSGIAISAILVASLLINNSQFVYKARAQGIAAPNATNKANSMTTGNKTAANHTGTVTSSRTDLNAVLNAVRNTNATSTATKNIINATAGNATNKSG